MLVSENLNLSWNDTDLVLFDGKPSFVQAMILAFLSMAVLLSFVMVQRAVILLLKRLPNRNFNLLVYPHICLSLITIPLYLAIFVGQNFIYPVKNLVGVPLCYAWCILEFYAILFLLFHSFFTTLYRYICIMKSHFLLQFNISGRALAQITVLAMFVYPTLVTIFCMPKLDEYHPILTCLGRAEMTLTYYGRVPVKYDNYLAWLSAKGLAFSTWIVASNIPDAYMLWKCFQETRNQTENARTMISTDSFVRRKRDDGMVISTAIIQWIVEVGYSAVLFCYYNFFFGYSHFADRCNALLNLFVYLVICPLFYLNGDPKFRRQFLEHGLLVALKSTLLN